MRSYRRRRPVRESRSRLFTEGKYINNKIFGKMEVSDESQPSTLFVTMLPNNYDGSLYFTCALHDKGKWYFWYELWDQRSPEDLEVFSVVKDIFLKNGGKHKTGREEEVLIVLRDYNEAKRFAKELGIELDEVANITYASRRQ